MSADAQPRSWWFPVAAMAVLTGLAIAVLVVLLDEGRNFHGSTRGFYLLTIAAAVLLVAALAQGQRRLTRRQAHAREDLMLTFVAAILYVGSLAAATLVFGPAWLVVPQVIAVGGLVVGLRTSGAAMSSTAAA
jgi:hypothetical protein